MRLASVEECQTIDRRAQAEYGLSGEILMESAGSRAALIIEDSYRADCVIHIVCGPGNNGADGLVVARHLAECRRKVRVFLLAPQERRSDLFKTQLRRCETHLIECVDLLKDPGSLHELAAADVIVDALYGIGFRGMAEGAAKDLINAINRAKVEVVSLDTPSGLDADRGLASGAAVRADLTIAFGIAKRGFFVGDGPACVGRLLVVGIGFARELVRQTACHSFLFTDRQAARLLPGRRPSSNKSKHGHTLILAGSPGMRGAGVLAALAAYRVGSGYVTLASRAKTSKLPEVLTAAPDDDALWSSRRKWTAAAVGPGLGVGPETSGILERLRGMEGTRVVVDADAITVAASQKSFPYSKEWIMTPHAGELSRVLGVKAAEIEADRFRFAREAALQTGMIVLLKGFRTVVSDGVREYVILAGNPALAKAGTGDVLTGMIAGLLAQGLKPLAAACLGAYLHGCLADEWTRARRSKLSLIATDLTERLPTFLEELRSRPARGSTS